MNKPVIIIAIITCILILISNFYSNDKDNKESSNLPDYYQQLALECETKENYSCCISSVNNMANENHKLSPDSGCPDDFQENMSRCLDSFKWCEPLE